MKLILMKVTAKLSNVRLTPRKARLVAGLIQGMHVHEAMVQLEKTVKKSSDPMLKLLQSAVANAKNNFSLGEENLYVALAQVNEGQKLKRWMPRAHGRATPIWRRLSHVTIVLEERLSEEAVRKMEQPTMEEEVVKPKKKEASSVAKVAKRRTVKKDKETE